MIYLTLLGMSKLYKHIQAHLQLISIFVGGMFVAAWTILRFLTERSIFDLVGQQVLAQSFLKDGFLDASVGATHYIVKLFLVYIPFHVSSIDPRWALILMTLLINIAAYVAIFFAIKSILRSFNIFRPKIFYIAMMWFATCAGSIFWIEFANSRNLEVAAGLWTIALGLIFMKSPSIKRGLLWMFVATLAFFMDPLQVYMTGLPLLIYLAVAELLPKPRTSWKKRVSAVVAVLGGSYILAKILLAIIVVTTGVIVISDSSSALGVSNTIGHLGASIKGQAVANIRLVAGIVGDGGRLRQALALLAVLSALGVWTSYAVRKKINVRFTVFVLIFSFMIQAIYFLSGQSVNGDTSRYLIMFAPMVVLVIASLPLTKLSRIVLVAIGVFTMSSGVFLGVSVVRAWPDRFANDQSLASVAEFVAVHGEARFYAGMDTAIPTMYYYPSATILPLACSSNGLERASTFYPKGSFEKYQSKSSALIGIIFDAQGNITNYPNICDKDYIIKRYGQPQQTQTTKSGQQILFYGAKSVSF